MATITTFENLELNSDLVVQWNGSATFNVMTREPMEGEMIEVDCFTFYGKDTQGGACTMEEAKLYAEDYLRDQDEADAQDVDEDDWVCNHCQVTHTADMICGCADEHGNKTCQQCWEDNKAEEKILRRAYNSKRFKN